MYSITQVGISEITSIIQMDVSSIYTLPHSYYTDERSRERDMDERVYEAAITGNVSSLSSLLSEDPNILDRVLVDEAAKETPLHIAALFGHVDFVKEILKEKPELARQLNSQGRTPLHVASAKGHTQVVNALLEKDTQACFVRDRDGMIPLHLAAIKGRVEAMKELVKSKTATILMATDGGEPLLHLCLKHDQFEAVKTLIEIAGDDREFMSLKDDDDNTLLHLLAAKGQYKITELLFPDDKNAKGLDVNAMNVNGSTPLDVLRDGADGRYKWKKIEKVLRSVEAKRARELPIAATRSLVRYRSLKVSIDKSGKWTDRTRDALMVVAILIATVTFQAALSPPGGVVNFDEDANTTTTFNHRHAGQAVMSIKFPFQYVIFMTSNAVGFVNALLLILLLLSGFSFKRMRHLVVITWICVISMFISYGCSLVTLATGGNSVVVLILGINAFVLGWGLSTAVLRIPLLFQLIVRFLKFMKRLASSPKEDPHHELIP